MLGLEKKKEKNKKAQGKGITCRSYVVLVIKTLRECDHILIVVLLRGVKLVSEYGYQSATRCSNSLHMHLGSSGMLTPLKMFVKIR